MRTSIRRIRPGDGQQVYQVFIDSVRVLGAKAYDARQIEAWLSGLTLSRLEGRLLATVSFVAERGGRIVGFASLDVQHLELDFLYVDPDFAGQGIGRRLSARVEKEATGRGIRRLFIVASLNALPVYERLGYRKESDMSKTIDGVTVPCVRMSKDLDVPPGR